MKTVINLAVAAWAVAAIGVLFVQLHQEFDVTGQATITTVQR